MLTHIEWGNGAVEDLERLHAFLDPKNPEAARRAAQTIIQATELLANNPRVGTLVEDMIEDGEYRDLTIPFGSSGYVLRFRYERDTVYILHIKHGKEELFRQIPKR